MITQCSRPKKMHNLKYYAANLPLNIGVAPNVKLAINIFVSWQFIDFLTTSLFV